MTFSHSEDSQIGDIPGGGAELWAWGQSLKLAYIAEDQARLRVSALGRTLDPRITWVVGDRIRTALDLVPRATKVVADGKGLGWAYVLHESQAGHEEGLSWLRSGLSSAPTEDGTGRLVAGDICDVVLVPPRLASALLRLSHRPDLRLGPVWRTADRSLGICLARGAVEALATFPRDHGVRLLPHGVEVTVPASPECDTSGLHWLRPPVGDPPYLPGPGTMLHLLGLVLLTEASGTAARSVPAREVRR